jgi:hypothetical protein
VATRMGGRARWHEGATYHCPCQAGRPVAGYRWREAGGKPVPGSAKLVWFGPEGQGEVLAPDGPPL